MAMSVDLVTVVLEHGLGAHPKINGVAVLPRILPGNGGEVLVAYIVPRELSDTEVLRDWLESNPVGPSLVSAFVFVSSLPFDSNGLIDTAVLEAIPVLDKDTLERWNEAVCEQSSGHCVVYPAHMLPSLKLTHRLDMYPLVEPLEEAAGGVSESTDDDVSGSPISDDDSQLSILHGESLDLQNAPRTLGEMLAMAASRYPGHGVTYVNERGKESFQTYPELLDGALQVAENLRKREIGIGDIVILLAPGNREYLALFWGCVLLGAVPAPVTPPVDWATGSSGVQKLINAWLMLEQPPVLTQVALTDAVTRAFESSGHSPVVLSVVGKNDADTPLFAELPQLDGNAMVLILLTSGSTGMPKGVMHSHKTLISRSIATAHDHSFTSDDVSLNWMPLDHVGGVVMFHLHEVYTGGNQIQVPTSWVLEQPTRWLDLMDNHAVSITWAPNFAYALVVDAIGEHQGLHWNLSSLRHIMNAGEATVAATVQRFMSFLSKYDLPGDCMFPAWGMSETSSAVTYSRKFASRETSVSHAPVYVGSPIPNTSLRIVDEHNNLVPQGTSGRLQVRGLSIMLGYFNLPETNAKVFTEDGWFDTGDIAVVRDDEMAIIGRAKDEIIVNGINIASSEIEAVINDIKGVDTSFSAVSVVISQEKSGDVLAVFFVPEDGSDEALGCTLKLLRETLAREFGIALDHYVPLRREDIPKTSIGKIQHSKLRLQFEGGQYDTQRKRADLLLGEQCIPAWFHRKIWRAAALRGSYVGGGSDVIVIFGDENGLGGHLRELYLSTGQMAILVGGDGDDHAAYQVTRGSRDSYEQLLQLFREQGYDALRFVHCRAAEDDAEEATTAAALRDAQEIGMHDVLALLQAVAPTGDRSSGADLTVVTRGSHVVTGNDVTDCRHAGIIGLVKTAPMEYAGLSIRQVDLDLEVQGEDARRVRDEMSARFPNAEVVYRDGNRLEWGLEPVFPKLEDSEGSLDLRGGRFVITGGLGGVGFELAKRLLSQFQAKLVLIGRSCLAGSDMLFDVPGDIQATSEKLQRYIDLKALGGEVMYAACDVTDKVRLEEVITQAEAYWNAPLAGVFHLAVGGGIAAGIDDPQRNSLENADSAAFEKMFEAKVYGTRALFDALEYRPEVFVVPFGSVLGTLGGANFGAYVSAHTFVDNYVAMQRMRRGRKAHVFSWSVWEHTGLSRTDKSDMSEYYRAVGYMIITPDRGVDSLIIGLTQNYPELLVGLDDRRWPVLRYLVDRPRALLQLVAFTEDKRLADTLMLKGSVNDRFNVPMDCRLVYLEQIPRTDDGAFDRIALVSLGSVLDTSASALQEPQGELEQLIAGIWSEILGNRRFGRNNGFFELGGNSLAATRLVARLRDRLNVSFEIFDLLSNGTIAGFAQLAEQRGVRPENTFSNISLEEIESIEQTSSVSPGQRRLWIINQLEEPNPSYNISFYMPVEGVLDIGLLESALNTLIQRQDSLRTFFTDVDGEPQQVVDRGASFIELRSVDFSTLSPAEAKGALKHEMKEEAYFLFDLTRAPLFRAKLVQLEPEKYVLLLVMHHIISDGWSVGLMAPELFGIYDALGSGREARLPELPMQYADYCRLQVKQFNADRYKASLLWWEQQLANLPLLQLPTDRPRPQVSTHEGATCPFTLSADLHKRLTALAETQGVTLYMLLLAAFSMLLRRYSGQEDIVTGVPVANRPDEKVANLMGFFVNTLVMRVDLSGNPTFNTLMERVASMTLGAYAHQDVAFDALVERLRPERDTSRNPLFQVAMVLQNESMKGVTLEGLRVGRPVVTGYEANAYDTGEAFLRVDLELHFWENDSGLSGLWLYDTGLFDKITIERMSHALDTILEAIVDAPQEKIAKLSILPADEQHRLIESFNAKVSSYPDSVSIHGLFEAWVDRAPDAVALSYDGEELSYSELDRKANRLAHSLLETGLERETLVGVCLERGFDLIVAFFAILKAGGAYLPLDPKYPPERLAFMIQDAGLGVLISRESLIDCVPDFSGQALLVDRPEACLSQDEKRPKREVHSSSLAYVIYTSGSTGKPKGAQLEHVGLCNVSAEQQRLFGAGPGERVLQFSSPNFDASLFDLAMSLTTGATLVLADPDAMRPGVPLLDTLRTERISIVTLPPSSLSVVPEGDLPDLRVINVAGEACSPSLIDRWAPGRDFFNLYGPTEATIWTTQWKCSAGEGIPPIGVPITDTRLYVLDQQGDLVPVGVSGELFIGGVGISRGYLNLPELNAERFLPDPFSEDGACMYRSGDRVRWRADGVLEFIGRVDHQVKVRGYRIELGEVEAALERIPAVASAVVAARGEAVDDRRLVAWIVFEAGVADNVDSVREALRDALPPYLLPSVIIPMTELPLTRNGKVNIAALPETLQKTASRSGSGTPNISALRNQIISAWSKVLERNDIGVQDNFFDIGGHSLAMARVHALLRDEAGIDVPLVDLFHYPTVDSLARELGEEQGVQPALVPVVRAGRQGGAVAIVGMSGRFPGAQSIAEFWENLSGGVESIRFFTDDELLDAGISESVKLDPDYVPARGWLEGADLFDAELFGYSPHEADVLDPQQRLFLETAWSALEDAAHDPEQFSGAIGVYAGTSLNRYFLEVLKGGNDSPYLDILSNDKDFLPSRVAYKLNLHGPAINVQTACSTSLVAVHQACQALLQGDCDIALAGGVSAGVPRIGGYLYQEQGILSPDGHCRAFSSDAGGTLAGEGVGIVVLRRLEDALADGDSIRAVIRGSAVNNDGSEKVGYTAPSVDGQTEVIQRALSVAGLVAEDIDFVETHGTGTALGDPIEIKALSRAYGPCGERKQGCALGAVKSNIGHTDAAAGVTGLIKTALVLQHGCIPPIINLAEPNPEIDFAYSGFYLNTELQDLPDTGKTHCAAVSSFGIGGTNAHVVLEAFPQAEPRDYLGGDQLLVISAASSVALNAASDQLAVFLSEYPEVDLAAVAWSLQSGRRALSKRRAMVVSNASEAVELLRSRDRTRVFDHEQMAVSEGVVFLFSGQGAQYVGMASGLYARYTVFRESVDQCSDLLLAVMSVDMRELVFEVSDFDLNDTRYAQPALFVIEYAMSQLWQSWGIRPAALIGHSIGELVAACVAGVMSLQDALNLIVARGRLMAACEPGSMLSVMMSAEDISPKLDDALTVASVNTPGMCVVSGPDEALRAFAERLDSEGIGGQLLHTSHAFHSSMMEPAVEGFAQAVAELTLSTPTLPFISNVSGDWISDEEATDSGYWGRHLRNTVNFSAGVKRLMDDGYSNFIEVGPGNTLVTFVSAHKEDKNKPFAVTSIRHPREDKEDGLHLLESVGKLWTAGVVPSWAELHGEQTPQRMSLPSYPFQRKRYWAKISVNQRNLTAEVTKAYPGSPWSFYVPSWHSTPPFEETAAVEELKEKWWFFDLGDDLSEKLVAKIEQRGGEVVRVFPSIKSMEERGGAIGIRPDAPKDYDRLLERLAEGDVEPARIVHAWSCASGDESDEQKLLGMGFYSLLFLNKALQRRWPGHEIRVDVLTTGSTAVESRDRISAAKSMVLAPAMVIPQEQAGCLLRVFDLAPESLFGISAGPMAGLLLNELQGEAMNLLVAYRGLTRWVREYQPLPERCLEGKPRIRDHGVYLITGGLGQVGLSIARYLAETVQARIVLTGRSEMPPVDRWDQFLAQSDGDEPTIKRIQAIRGLEELGAEVLTLAVDVTNQDAMIVVVDVVLKRFGQLNGVIHAAGVLAGDSFVAADKLTKEACEAQFAPKIAGLQVLHKVLKDQPLDFVSPVSSLASVLGGLNFTAYAAGNLYMDAWCQARQRDNETQWLCMNWDGWQGDSQGEGITSVAGGRLFGAAMSCGSLAQLLVAADDFETRLSRQVTSVATEEAEKKEELHERPELDNELVAPETDSQKLIADHWMKLFGIAEVGIRDGFYELGGHSLVAIQAVARIRKVFNVSLSINEFLTLGTIEQIADRIDAMRWVNVEDENEVDTSSRDEFEI